MTNYTPSDFTDIRGPEEKPTVPGWYAYAPEIGKASLMRARLTPSALNVYWFDWFDGNDWRCDNNMRARYWFGLKEKP